MGQSVNPCQDEKVIAEFAEGAEREKAGNQRAGLLELA